MAEDRLSRQTERVGKSVRERFREAAITGMAVVVPIVVTVFVVVFLVNAVYQYVDIISNVVVALPVLGLIPNIIGVSPETIVELTVPTVVFVAIMLIGLVVNSSKYGEKAVDYFDYVVTLIPGVGGVYESFRQMSEAMIDSEVQNFRNVKLVQFPHDDTYTIGFVTTETPDVLSTPAGHPDMLTLFIPLAPNPIMGGHLVHVPESRVIDVDMTVEEGVQAIVTSGVAMGEEEGAHHLSVSGDAHGEERTDGTSEDPAAVSDADGGENAEASTASNPREEPVAVADIDPKLSRVEAESKTDRKTKDGGEKEPPI